MSEFFYKEKIIEFKCINISFTVNIKIFTCEMSHEKIEELKYEFYEYNIYINCSNNKNNNIITKTIKKCIVERCYEKTIFKDNYEIVRYFRKLEYELAQHIMIPEITVIYNNENKILYLYETNIIYEFSTLLNDENHVKYFTKMLKYYINPFFQNGILKSANPRFFLLDGTEILY